MLAYGVPADSTDEYLPKMVYSCANHSRSSWSQKKFFAMRQESCRKDVERAFGVLQSRFAIVAGPSRLWNKKNIA
uniref:DDE Tnp4 domain-containing protein n=1 Tax=Brassica oleracea TaxID=3712 RepID=A0A3P6G3M4_BRAOL|nr:unnamed protein product [Brassica oleracea]